MTSSQATGSDVDLFSKGNRLLHLITTQQFTRPLLEDIFDLGERARRLYTTRIGAAFLRECLPNRRALLYFVQPSTRTFLSFQAAAAILGMATAQVTSPETSSEAKGESPLDSVHTFAMYHDLVVMRYPTAGFADECARRFLQIGGDKHIINGGSGMDQHPTQALLDVYTLHREFTRRGGIDGKRVAVVGDLARGRAARSLIYLLSKYTGVSIDLVSPASLRMKDDLKEYMAAKGMTFHEHDRIGDWVTHADALYMTRIQDEYDAVSPAGTLDYGQYSVTDDVLHRLKSDAVILHPLPRRAEIPPAVDSDPRSRYWEQVENGMWARVALISHMFEADLRIRAA